MRSRGNIPLALLALLFVLTLTACASSRGVAPIEGRDQPPSRELRLHIVSSGDTLYSIAFRYEKDVQWLAQNNALGSGYAIFPGQRIYLTADAAVAAGVSANPSVAAAPPVRASSSSSSSTGTSPSTAPRVATPAPRPAAAVATPLGSTQVGATGDADWIWPRSGAIVQGFGRGEPASKGIQISAARGDAVYASADGEVVYAGTGLRGYGNLLIVKHNETYLSAYAHNDSLLVKEQDQVHAGQSIATVGVDLEGNSRLYFEIRRNGTPVDPVRYLPSR